MSESLPAWAFETVRILHQGGRADRAGPEPAGDLVERLLGFPPADRPVIEAELGIRARGRYQPGCPDADQPQPGAAVQPRRLVQRAGCGVYLTGYVGWIRQGTGTGQCLEAGQPELDRDGPGHVPAGAQSFGGPAGQPQQLAADPVRVIDVGGEGLLGADALLPRVRRDLTLVAAPGQGGQVRAVRGAEVAFEGVQRGVRDVAHRPQAQAGQDLFGPVPDSPQRGHRQRVQEIQHAGPRYHQHAIRLAAGRGDLGHELRRRDPDRAGDALLLLHLGADARGDRGGGSQPAQRAGDVEERLVQRERLDLGRDRAEDRHDLLGGRGVDPVPGRDEYRLWAQPTRPHDRHGRADPERASRVRRGQDHAAAAGRAHDDRLARELGPVPDLDAGVEGVHVHVQDVTARVVRRRVLRDAHGGSLMAVRSWRFAHGG